ncbi:UNVERIFIED_CONTAM: hypothetical protein K2H54_017700 [Gekko kuhli]
MPGVNCGSAGVGQCPPPIFAFLWKWQQKRGKPLRFIMLQAGCEAELVGRALGLGGITTRVGLEGTDPSLKTRAYQVISTRKRRDLRTRQKAHPGPLAKCGGSVGFGFAVKQVRNFASSWALECRPPPPPATHTP